MENINSHSSSDRLIQAINSHSNLIEFSYKSTNINGFLEPFCKNYPSLKVFEYGNRMLESSQPLFKVLESNSQLISLKLELICCGNSLTNHINCHLKNLEELSLTDIISINQDTPCVYAIFSQFIKIKKLKLIWNRLSPCSLNSIIFYCPELDELSLSIYRNSLMQDSTTHISVTKPTKIKKLELISDSLSGISLDSILINSPNLIELDIKMPRDWKEWMKVISERCTNLLKLNIGPANQMKYAEICAFVQEIHESKFLTGNSIYKSTLTHLTLNKFDYYDSKAEYFNNFKKLKSIKFPFQTKIRNRRYNHEDILDEALWPKYRVATKEYLYNIDIEMLNLNV
jgi:hypothetical protein